MHKTLKAAAIRPPRATLAAQQRAFNVFRREFNDERPHAALHGRPPGSLYQASSRPFTGELPPIDYPGHFLVKRAIRFKKRLVFVSHALTPHPGRTRAAAVTKPAISSQANSVCSSRDSRDTPVYSAWERIARITYAG